MNIGEVAKLSGLSAKTIRYYESIGVIEAARRGENGYRSYDKVALRKLKFIRRSRDAGFSLEQCQKLLSLYLDPTRSSAEVKALAEQKLSELELKIAGLQEMADNLRELTQQCLGDENPQCPIIENLSDSD
ncbi:Cu(I)-responsive transcriptional regulator [Dongshaea marina]|uniref:Cu(I)-responsive transcriptional regulator n=1 Tax=Dongshaea marina TaxID=2047966 RepID=UPI000D3E512F|nr:Cu(I)-responsive transcriptional regulator [Dongshaea marina]